MNLTNYVVLFVAVFLISAVQVVIKLRLDLDHGLLPSSITAIPAFILGLMRDPWLWVAGMSLLTAAYLWYFSLSRLPLGVAFSFAALSYPMVMVGSAIFLGEAHTLVQYAGSLLLILGIYMIAS